MKKNVAQLVFNVTDKNVLSELLVNYLPEDVLDKIIYHLSGDEEIKFSIPEIDEEKFIAEKTESGLLNVQVTKVTLDTYNQKVSINYKYDEVRYYSSEEKAAEGQWGGKCGKSDEYPFEGLYHSSSCQDVTVKEYMEKYTK